MKLKNPTFSSPLAILRQKDTQRVTHKDKSKDIDSERKKEKNKLVEIRRRFVCAKRDMVFRGDTVMSVAHFSADIFQRWIPASERIRSGEMLQLVCCFPLQELGRFVAWFWNYICVPPPEILYYERSSSSSSSSIVNSQNYYNLHLE